MRGYNMDTHESIFDTLDLDEIRRLIGEETLVSPSKPELKLQAAEEASAAQPEQNAHEVPDAPKEQPETDVQAEEPAQEKAPQQPDSKPEAAEPQKRQPTRKPARQTSSAQQDVDKALEQHREDAQLPDAPRGYETFTMLHDLVNILAVLTVVFVFFFRLVGVSGESMIPTFYDKDYLILESNFLYKNVRSGDIIVMNVEADGISGPIVKRVIATEGQTVDIDFQTGEVSVDGKILIEPYIYEPTYESYESYGLGMEYPVTVPKGQIFVMGDDRNHSADSRYSPIGCVSTDRVLGKVLFLVFPGRQTDVYGNVIGKRDFSRIGVVS